MSETKSTMKIYTAEVWHGDFHFTRIFTSRKATEKAIAEALKKAKESGEYISDTSVCEMQLEGTEFINTYSKRPEF